MTGFGQQTRRLDGRLRVGENFDAVKKEFLYGGRIRSAMYYLSGLTNVDQCEKLLSFMLSDVGGAESFGRRGAKEILSAIPQAQGSVIDNEDEAITAVCGGCTLLIFEGCGFFILLDLRKYPARGIEEPQKDKVLRGSRDGFAEALPMNLALIRRRIRDPRLVCRHMQIGASTATDLVICYMEGAADMRYVNRLRAEFSKISTMGLNLGLETLTELLTGRSLFNPFPKVRYTERPDAAAAMLLEGKIIVLCDNYPASMILPTSIFDFLQDTDDFYFSPVIGGYMKFVRNIVYAFSLLLTPVWYALQQVPQYLPEAFRFLIFERGDSFMPLLLQLLLVEIAIDGLKLASLNTPDTLSNSLSVISGLILGDLAVSVGWLSEQVILYMAFVAIANFTQPSFELGYAFKFMRILTLVLISVFAQWGLLVGIVLTVTVIASNRSVCAGKGYLYPLIPFDRRAMSKLFLRGKAGNERFF